MVAPYVVYLFLEVALAGISHRLVYPCLIPVVKRKVRLALLNRIRF